MAATEVLSDFLNRCLKFGPELFDGWIILRRVAADA